MDNTTALFYVVNVLLLFIDALGELKDKIYVIRYSYYGR